MGDIQNHSCKNILKKCSTSGKNTFNDDKNNPKENIKIICIQTTNIKRKIFMSKLFCWVIKRYIKKIPNIIKKLNKEESILEINKWILKIFNFLIKFEFNLKIFSVWFSGYNKFTLSYLKI